MLSILQKKIKIIHVILMLFYCPLKASNIDLCTARHPREPVGINNVHFPYNGKCGKIGIDRTVTDIFSIIGDFGDGKDGEKEVARLMDHVAKYHNHEYRDHQNNSEMDFVVTVGDNAYPSGFPENIDASISSIYGKYIYHAKKCSYLPGHPKKEPGEEYLFAQNKNTSSKQRFFPCLGNHDSLYKENSEQYYLAYFDYLKNYPPYNGKKYTVRISKHIQLFILDSNDHNWLYQEQTNQMQLLNLRLLTMVHLEHPDIMTII